EEDLDGAGYERGRVQGVVGLQRIELEAVGRLGVGDRDQRGEAADLHLAGVAADVDRVVAGGAVHVHPVDRSVARRPAEAAGKVDVDTADVGSAEVVDGDEVGAAEGVHVDLLDTGGGPPDVSDRAGGTQPRPL